MLIAPRRSVAVVDRQAPVAVSGPVSPEARSSTASCRPSSLPPTAASYEVRSAAAVPGGWRVVVECTLFLRPQGAGQELVQVCRTEDEWIEHDGRWLLRSQRELAFPEDGEVAAAARPPESGRLRRLLGEFKARGEPAVDALVADLRERGPLVETIDSDPTRRLVTFLYRGDPTVQTVAMAGAPTETRPRRSRGSAPRTSGTGRSGSLRTPGSFTSSP